MWTTGFVVSHIAKLLTLCPMTHTYSTAELTQLQQVLYEILNKIDEICIKHDIPYFVIGGTAIGALYDKAILPWDDDIDIGMTRENYNRFLRIAPQELGADYFLSWQETDPHTPYYFAKVKKNKTLFVERMFKNVPMHPGIFVDIFPFDKIPDNLLLRRIQFEAVNFLKCCLIGKEAWIWKHFGTCEIETPTNRGRMGCLLNRCFNLCFTKRFTYRLIVWAQSCFNGWNTAFYNNVITKTDHVKKEEIEKLQRVPFGPLMVTAPQNLEGFLRRNYPSLHRFTPEEVATVNTHYPHQLSFNTDAE